MPDKDPSEVRLRDFLAQFGQESDRASVILAAAVLENALAQVLQGHFVPSPSADDALFASAYAPLNSLSAKIDISFRVGLISARFARDLHLIRRIRNGFAHDPQGCTMTAPSVRDRVTDLCRSHNLTGDHSLRDLTGHEAKKEFMVVVGAMLLHLWGVAEFAKKLTAKAEEACYQPGKWTKVDKTTPS